MRKLQLRLSQTQTDDILATLAAAIHLGEAGPQLDRYRTLRSWLTWRRVKMWGELGRIDGPEAHDDFEAQLAAELDLP